MTKKLFEMNDGFFDEDAIKESQNVPNCCKGCPNFKGKGTICDCTLPTLEQTNYTENSGNTKTYYSNGTQDTEQLIKG